ncbi:MAG: membrane dipeptidase [Oscillospiraceae bacterium]|nr:membrane dipeptidase [Oscillospiraceae bacterium]
MRLFDLHCDTLTKCMKEGTGLACAPGHVSLKKGVAAFERWAQVFAAFVPDTLHGPAAWAYFCRCAAFYQAQLPQIARVCTPFFALENANALAGDLRRLEAREARQLKLITLTWNGENELGYGAACDPRLGLKPFGKEAVERMFLLGMVPDVSHLNRAGFWEVLDLAARCGKPVVASHSNCAAVHPHRRNLDDEQLQAIFSLQSLVGLNFCTEFLGGTRDANAVAAHCKHLLQLGGAAHIALGTDFDGCHVHPAMAGLETLPALNRALAEQGLAPQTRDHLFWGNAARFFGVQ